MILSCSAVVVGDKNNIQNANYKMNAYNYTSKCVCVIKIEFKERKC